MHFSKTIITVASLSLATITMAAPFAQVAVSTTIIKPSKNTVATVKPGMWRDTIEDMSGDPKIVRPRPPPRIIEAPEVELSKPKTWLIALKEYFDIVGHKIKEFAIVRPGDRSVI